MRTSTPPHQITRDDGTTATRHTVQRCCNGCEQPIGDATQDELAAAVSGEPLPDVRSECPRCTPTAPTDRNVT